MSLKLTFKIVNSNEFAGDFDYKPFNVRATMTDHSGRTDTMTEMRGFMIDEVQVWCLLNNCGSQYQYVPNFGGHPIFGFDTEEQLALFLLRWA